MDPRVQNMADVLVNYSVEVQPGQWVVINSNPEGEPLINACYRAVLAAGGHPTVQTSTETTREMLFRHGSDGQLTFISPTQRQVVEQADVLITILAPRNTHALAGVDPARMALSNRAMGDLMATYLKREQEGSLHWTGCQYPTEAAAQDAHMSLADYQNFVYGACLVERPDPVAAWREQVERQQRVIDWLQDKSEVHITGPGTDLRVNVAGRTWINDEGKQNFPGGEVFTGPQEGATEGSIQFNFPAVYQGREIDGIRLTFKEGRVVEATATRDQEYLIQMLDLDEGARRLGEFAFGTNPGIQQFTRNTLFDEKISGTLHMALGLSIPGTGGENQSSLHWDLVYNLREGGEVTVDGQPFSRNGEFVF